MKPWEGRLVSRHDHALDPIWYRFWSKVSIRQPHECWPWAAAINVTGYGAFGIGQKMYGAHRVAYWLIVGEWPEVCRHTCDNRPCVNPMHLRDGTAADNNRDALTRTHVYKTHCPAGHAYEGRNRTEDANGRQRCRECHNRQCRESRARMATRRAESP